MPISFSTTAGGTGYQKVLVYPADATVHQRLLNAAALAGSRDADGNLPPGLGISATGGRAHAGAVGTTPAEVAVAVIGPEPVKLGSVNIFGNTIEAGVLNGDAIRDNVGAALGATLPPQIKIL